jgi:hypothetical protein
MLLYEKRIACLVGDTLANGGFGQSRSNDMLLCQSSYNHTQNQEINLIKPPLSRHWEIWQFINHMYLIQ